MTQVAPSRRCRRHVGGFTLLEALVALALLSATGLALIAWMNQSLDSARRLADLRRRAAVQIEASQYVETINPMLRESGEAQIGGLAVAWQATPRGPAANSVAHATNSPGDFRLALYELAVTARAADLAEPVRFTQLALGWRRVNAPATL